MVRVAWLHKPLQGMRWPLPKESAMSLAWNAEKWRLQADVLGTWPTLPSFMNGNPVVCLALITAE